MPVLQLATQQGSITSIVTAIIVWCGLFTTIISCVYILGNFLNKYIKNYRLTTILILLSALVCSKMGFEFMVSYIYSLIGVVGLVFVIFVLRKERETFVIKVSRKK
jgi:uncharacterized membrane protein YkvI